MAKVTLVKRIMAFLNLSEDAKVVNFLARVQRKVNDEIRTLEHNRKTTEMEFTTSIEKVEDDLADAKVDLENSFLVVDIEKLGSNAQNDKYAVQYLENIAKARNRVKNLEETLKATKDLLQTHLEDYNTRIANLKEVLANMEA